MDNSKWLLKEEDLEGIDREKLHEILFISNPKSDFIVFLLKTQLDHAEPLMRADEAKKYEGKIEAAYNKGCDDTAQAMKDEGWKSPETIEELIAGLVRDQISAVKEARQDEHARTLKAVGKWLEKIILTFSAWSFSGEPRMKIIRLIDALKSGEEPEGFPPKE
jgi:hypothetical protein